MEEKKNSEEAEVSNTPEKKWYDSMFAFVICGGILGKLFGLIPAIVIVAICFIGYWLFEKYKK